MYLSKQCCIRDRCLLSGKSGCIRENGYILVKVVVFGRSGCKGAKMVLFGQKWFFSGKSG